MVFLPPNGRFNKYVSQFLWNVAKCDDPLLRFFLSKWDPCLRIFGEKVTHLGFNGKFTAKKWFSDRAFYDTIVEADIGSLKWVKSLGLSHYVFGPHAGEI